MASIETTASLEVWAEWRRITRFLESVRLAFARERSTWASLAISSPEKISLKASADVGEYEISLGEHLEVIDDAESLYAAVLIQTYSLTEYAASLAVGAAGERLTGGIESWGAKMLALRGNSWSDVLDGLGGVVEVAVVRDAFAHGTRKIDATAEGRLRGVGVETRLAGDAVTLNHAQLRKYRARLKSLLRVGGFNVPEADRSPA